MALKWLCKTCAKQ